MIPQYTHEGLKRARTIAVTDPDRVMDSLVNGEPITMKDAVLQPVNSQKRKKLLADIDHLKVQLGRLSVVCDKVRAEVLSLTVED